MYKKRNIALWLVELGLWLVIQCATTLPLEVLSQRNFVADFIQLKLTFIPKKGKVRCLSHPLGDLEVTYALPSIARWKARLRLPIRHNWNSFTLAVTVETLQAEICRREPFLKGVGHFNRPLKVEGDVIYA